MSVWLFVVAGMVYAIVIVGAITRLTESGLSIVDWRPITGMIPPLTDEEWEAEFAKYKTSPEFAQNSHMTLEGFKSIFFWEWFHRVLGRTVGMVYFLPFIVFSIRGRVKNQYLWRILLGLGCLGGAQGVVGWLMVKSGLEHERFENGSKATVSPYRLALHLGLAFTLYLSLVTTAVHMRRGTLLSKVPGDLLRVKRSTELTGAWVFATAMTGAAVAGLDAGWIYCEFPMMGEGLVPPREDLIRKDLQPAARNLFENPVFAQFAHRCMAMGALAAVAAMSYTARGVPLPLPAFHALRAVQALAVFQVSLGITTLCLETPIPLAVAHQGTSLALLTSLVCLRVLLFKA